MTVRKPIELTCQEVVELITELLSQAMEPEDQARVEQHLLTCPPCTTYVGQLRRTIELARGLGGDPPAGDAGADQIEADLIARFRAWKQK